MLLSLVPTAAGRPADESLGEVLGMPAETAAARTARMLERPHPIVGCGVALWRQASLMERSPGRLPDQVETGPVPDQAALDRWAHDKTMGIIDTFPITVDALTALVMATAVATKVLWLEPYRLVPVAELGPGSTWTGLDTVLRADGPGNRIFDTDQAGRVAVHRAVAAGGLSVYSVIAAPAVAPLDVLAAAHELATVHARTPGRSLFDLPLGDGQAWVITEEKYTYYGPDDRSELYEAVLPQWSADTDLDLADPATGFPDAAGLLAGALGLAGAGYQARQAARARYHRLGFEAAAVTTMAFPGSALRPSGAKGTMVARTARLRFAHPFAVVAVCDTGAEGPGPWDGLPVFSAWITDPENADND
jgi:hypothetical protein